MHKLSILDKNAYLSIVVSENTITANLAYSHYEIERSYVLSDHTQYDYYDGELQSTYFWESYFESLQKMWGWKFIKDRQETASFRPVLDFEDEGNGISKLRVSIWNHFKDAPKIIEAIRSISTQIVVESLDQNRVSDRVTKVAEKLGYQDVLYLDLNPVAFRLTRATKTNAKANLKNIKVPTWEFNHGKIGWKSRRSLIDAIRSAKFNAFLSLEDPQHNYRNIWANFIMQPNISPAGGGLQDLLRAFTTVQLYSIYNDNSKEIKGFGTKSRDQNDKKLRSLLVIDGLNQLLLNDKDLVIAIFDGLQLRGSFDLFFDRHSRFVSLGDQYSQGVNADTYIVTSPQIGFEPYKIYIPEVPGHANENKVVFDGMNQQTLPGKEGLESITQPVFALSQQVLEYKIPNDGRNYISGKFVKGSYVEGLGEEIDFTSGKDGSVIYEKLFVDARFKPVVYGPTAKENKKQMNKWLS